MRWSTRISTALIICLIAVSGFAAEKPTIAVLPFVTDELIRMTIGNQELVPRQLETEFTHQLMEFLVKSRKFNILERDYLLKIMNENKITESDYVKEGEAERIGKLLVADYLLIGKIDRLEARRKTTRIEITGEDKVDLQLVFKLHFRVSEVKSGKVVFMHSLVERLRDKDIPFAERKDMTQSDYKDRIFKTTAEKAGNLVLEGIYPVKVASVQNEIVVLNRGEGAGINIGKKYAVFKVGDIVVDPDTGEALGGEEIEIGLIQITSVEPKFSKAKIIKCTSPIQIGSICRSVITEEPEKAAPDYPRVTPAW